MSCSSTLTGPWRRGQRVAWTLEQWPEADRDAWIRARQAGNLLHDDGRAAAWRPTTVVLSLSIYGRFLAFLDREHLLKPDHRPGDRLTPAVLDHYLTGLRSSCAPVTVASHIVWLTEVIRALAPDRDWSWLVLVRRKLQRHAEPRRNKRAKVVPAADLYAFGQDLMRRGRLESGQDKDRLLAFRDGLMIATLISLPLRLSNFTSIEIGRQLSWVGAEWLLSFSAEEMKNARALEFPYPSELNEALEHYLRLVRPGLIELGRKRYPQGRGRDPGQHLWISLNGTPLQNGGFVRILKTRTPARFGHVINPHLFRDCAATSIMTEIPGHVRIAAKVLGHATLQTTERYYILANTRRELCRYQQEVLALRRQGRRR